MRASIGARELDRRDLALARSGAPTSPRLPVHSFVETHRLLLLQTCRAQKPWRRAVRPRRAFGATRTAHVAAGLHRSDILHGVDDQIRPLHRSQMAAGEGLDARVRHRRRNHLVQGRGKSPRSAHKNRVGHAHRASAGEDVDARAAGEHRRFHRTGALELQRAVGALAHAVEQIELDRLRQPAGEQRPRRAVLPRCLARRPAVTRRRSAPSTSRRKCARRSADGERIGRRGDHRIDQQQALEQRPVPRCRAEQRRAAERVADAERDRPAVIAVRSAARRRRGRPRRSGPTA